MRRLLLLGLLLLAGCRNVDGPLARSPFGERADDPRYSIREQEARGRAFSALPDGTLLGGPNAGASRATYGTSREFDH